MVTHVFYAAWEVRRAGISVDDGLLRAVEAFYTAIPVPQDPGCGLRSLPWVNSCMDDLSLTASGAAWIAAYETSMGRTVDPSTSSYVRWARSLVGAALSPMSDNGGGPCFLFLETLDDGYPSRALRRGRGNGPGHGRRPQPREPGLRPRPHDGDCERVRRALLRGRTLRFTESEVFISRELFRHAQGKALPDGSAFEGPGPGGCLDFTDPDGPTKDCADGDMLVWSSGGYRPADFPLRLFYAKRGVDGMAPLPALQFDALLRAPRLTSPGRLLGPEPEPLLPPPRVRDLRVRTGARIGSAARCRGAMGIVEGAGAYRTRDRSSVIVARQSHSIWGGTINPGGLVPRNRFHPKKIVS